LDPAHRLITDRPLRIYFWLAFGITWGFGGLGLLAGAFQVWEPGRHMHPLHLVAAFGPSIAGVVMAGVAGGWPAIGRMSARVVPNGRNLLWYLAVIVIYPATGLAATWLIAPDALARVPSWDRMLILVPITLITDTGPLGEEFGWRGFALPRMLDRLRPLAAAVILGLIWFAWHLPTFFISTLSQSHLSIPLFIVNSVSLSILMTWLYLRTRGDLLLMILVHTIANYSSSIGIPFGAEVAAQVVMAALVVGTQGLTR
jgi:membrane protease YdiL (CAAX protease family)